MAEEVKKKVVFEDRPAELDDFNVGGIPMPAQQAPVAEAPLQPVRAPAKRKEEGFWNEDNKRAALVGLTPLLFGILTGNTVEGAEVAGDALIAEDKRVQDKQAKQSKGSLEQRLAEMRLQRELARTVTERERTKGKSAGRLEDKHVVEVEGKDGKPIIMTNDEAVELGLPAWKKSGDQDNFHLDDKMKLETHKAGLKKSDADKMDPYKQAKGENELYRLYQKDSETTTKMGDAYTRFKGTLSRPPSAANDLATIFNYMKILDPGSVVREGEQASAANAVAVPDAVRAMYNRLLLGKDQMLPAGLREKFFDEATAMYKSQTDHQSTIDGHYKGISDRRGMDSRNILRQFPKVKSTVTYTNKEGDSLDLDTSKLTPRMKKDLEKDGYSTKGN